MTFWVETSVAVIRTNTTLAASRHTGSAAAILQAVLVPLTVNQTYRWAVIRACSTVSITTEWSKVNVLICIRLGRGIKTDLIDEPNIEPTTLTCPN